MKETVLKLENIYKIYKMGTEKLVALDDVSITVNKGDFVSILGPSGSGKSTLLHIIGLLDEPSEGKIYVDGIETSKMSETEKAKIRNIKIGFVFQNFNLVPTITVKDNVALPCIIGEGMEEEKATKKAVLVLEKLGLGNRLNHYPSELSGGQRQRVAIARALVNDPEIVMADEPTGNLDTRTGHEVLEVLRKLNQEGRTILIITHDQEVAKLTKRTIEIRDGKAYN